VAAVTAEPTYSQADMLFPPATRVDADLMRNERVHRADMAMAHRESTDRFDGVEWTLFADSLIPNAHRLPYQHANSPPFTV
jgi:hypothetical protein